MMSYPSVPYLPFHPPLVGVSRVRKTAEDALDGACVAVAVAPDASFRAVALRAGSFIACASWAGVGRARVGSPPTKPNLLALAIRKSLPRSPTVLEPSKRPE